MDTLFSPLIQTKYCIPKQRLRIVSRLHLLERLASGEDADLVLVSAPAGYGKTTLLVEWCQTLLHKNVTVAWYSLDENDDNILTFSSYLSTCFASVIGAGQDLEQIGQHLRTSPDINLRLILPVLINAVASFGHRIVFVLDDYHLVTNPVIHNAVAFLLEHLPANLCVVIGSRTDTAFSLGKLRARGKLLEIRTSDLQFSQDETTQFLNSVMQLDLPMDLINELESRTEGWVAGLQLASISLADREDKADFIRSFNGGQRYFVEYLLDEVFYRLPEDIQSFLIRTSVLERLCGQLCDATTGKGSGSSEILLQLDRENRFIVALDDVGCWYRYHNLFREFLLNRLKITQPESISELHRVASGWYLENGFMREAVQHALLSKDWDYAASLVEQYGVGLMLHGEYSTMHSWCKEFPEEVLMAHPSLCLFQSNALIFSNRLAFRDLIEKRLSQIEQSALLIDDPWLSRLFYGQAAVTRTLLPAVIPDPTVNPRKHFILAQKALDLISEDDPGRSAVGLATGYAYMAMLEIDKAFAVLEDTRRLSLKGEVYFGVVEAAFHQARIVHVRGELNRVIEICRLVRDEISTCFAHPDKDLPIIGCLHIAEGCVDLEQDRLDIAEQKILHGLNLIGWGLNPFYQMTACIALFRLYEFQDRSKEALAILNRLDEAWPDVTFLLDGFRLLHSLRITPNNLALRAKVRTWSTQVYSSFINCHPLPGVGPYGGAEVFYQSRLIWIRLQLISGEIHTARAILEPLLEQALTARLTHRVIELSLLEAWIAQQESDTRSALLAVERALLAGEPEGFLRIFNGYPDVDDLLARASAQGICPVYIKQVMSVIRNPIRTLPGFPGSRHGLIESLSDREIEVLRLLAQGATNQLIAAQLVITVGTVKSHINHILAKLGAQNRTEAAARAREMDLL